MKRILLLFMLCTLFSIKNNAQENPKKNAFAISFGSPGYGFTYARSLKPKLNLVVAYHRFSLNDFEIKDYDISGDKVDILTSLKTGIIDLGIEYLPFTNSSFKLTAGFGYLSKLNSKSLITYTEEVKFGDVVISKNDVGEIDADITWSGIAPYVGIGFGRAIPKKRFGISFELGTYFTSSPDAILTASKLLAPTGEQEENLKEALKSFKFIPRAQIKLSYKF